MWQPYLKVVREHAGQALTSGPYHIMATMNKAIDKIRAAEAKRLKADGYEEVFEAFAVVPAEATRKPDREADGQVTRVAAVNPERPCVLSAPREFQRFWTYRFADLGSQVPARVVYPGRCAVAWNPEGCRPLTGGNTRTS